MPLTEITFDICKTVCPNEKTDRNDETITNFLKELSSEKEITSIRLLICIAIDTKNSVVQTGSNDSRTNSYIKNLRECILTASKMGLKTYSFPNGLTNRWKFAWALNQMVLKDRIPCIKSASRSSYSRIYNFRSFMLWVVGINKSRNLGIDKIVDSPEDLFRYYSFFKKNGKYSTLKVGQIGNSSFVFVADKEELNNIGYENTPEIIDGLGLYMKDTKEAEKFICLEYDSNFIEETWQPDSLTGDWGKIDHGMSNDGNDFFLSFYKLDSYGRTYSVSGKGNSFKERVHLPFDLDNSKSYLMEAKDLGHLVAPLQKGSDDAIIEEALNRYYKTQ